MPSYRYGIVVEISRFRYGTQDRNVSCMQTSADQLIADAGNHHAAGRLNEAEAAYRAALAREPGRIETRAGLGILLSQLGSHAEALELLPHELVIRAGLPLLLVARGASLLATGSPEAAVECLQRAVQLEPASHEAHNTLGCALLAQKRYLESVNALRRAIQLHPGYAEAYFNLGLTLYAAGMSQEAADIYRRAAQLRPYPQALLNRGFALRRAGDLDGAIASFHEALAISPSFDQAMHNLGATLADTGNVHEGCAWIRRAIAANPANHHAHSALIYLLNFDPEAAPEEIALEQQRWHERHAARFATEAAQQPSEPLRGRRIRLGYVSPDFRAHAEARFLLPLFENHNRLQFEIHCYSSVENPDDYTERFRKLADRWHEVAHLTDEQLADRIREDRIDILIDLTMHMEGGRLLTFARKPARLQLCWLAYPGATGLRTIDYFITDRTLRGTSQTHITEKPLPLPDSWFCYQPDRGAPPVQPLPALNSGSITFGSLNTYRKMSPAVVLLWADAMNAAARSQPKTVRLLLSCPPGRHREEFLAQFATHGIAADRIEFLAHMSYSQYLAAYHRIDIALDPFPHNGATTTLDAFYMGVPVLSLAGKTPAGRLGESILTNAGLADWIARSGEEFVMQAALRTRDIVALASLRSALRSRLMNSPLTDAAQFTINFETALIKAQWE